MTSIQQAELDRIIRDYAARMRLGLGLACKRCGSGMDVRRLHPTICDKCCFEEMPLQ